MRSNRIGVAGAIVVLLLCVARSWPAADAAAVAFPPDPVVVAAFDELIAHLSGIPPRVLDATTRQHLLVTLNTSRKQYLDGDICAAHAVMNEFLKATQGYRASGRVAVSEDLYNRGRQVRDSVFDMFISDPKLARPDCFDGRLRQPPRVTLDASDNTHVQATVTLGAPRLSTATAGGETWTEVTIPGLQPRIGQPGMPSMPSWQTLIAIPRGSTPVLVQGAVSVPEGIDVNLYPFQREPSDAAPAAQASTPPNETFADKPFVKNAKAYATDQLTPATPCAVRFLGPMRDLQIAQVQCVAGQYNPVTDELRLFDWIRFEVQFKGGNATFVTSQSLNPFEPASSAAVQAVLNREAAVHYVENVATAPLECAGEELLILTHPSYSDAANELAAWKQTKGIATTVIEVGAGTAHASGNSIKQLIANRYLKCLTRVSYVLLIGDSDVVPPARKNYYTKNEPDSTTGSDWGYATLAPFEWFPFIAVGRLTTFSSENASYIVGKIIRYESNPPFVNIASGGPFYTTATIASYFQCCRNDSPISSFTGRDMRSYIENSETARNVLMAAGHTVERIYTTDTDLADVPVYDTRPRQFYDGAALPPDLAPASGFSWSGSTRDIIDAFNAGRFLIIHRDHGEDNSWWRPSFKSVNLDQLRNNDLLPVVYSIDCKSGYWDNESDGGNALDDSLMEELLTHPYGMVGGIGDNRRSPSWANSALLRGFVDGTWPDLAPEFGGNTPTRRLGDILNHGKRYLATQIGVAQPGSDVSERNYYDEVVLFHVFGDPTLEMWTSNPYLLPLPPSAEITVQLDGVVVTYPHEGAEITALQVFTDGSTRPLARGTVAGGVARLPFILPRGEGIDPATIALSASAPNSVSVSLKSASATARGLIR